MDIVAYSLAKKKLLQTQKKYDADLDAVVDLAAIPTIPRAKLEYPTEDVNFPYLETIRKVIYTDTIWEMDFAILLDEVFTDKAITQVLSNGQWTPYRYVDDSNMYHYEVRTQYTTQDTHTKKVLGGTGYTVGYEAIDLNAYYMGQGMASVSGSTHKAFRADLTTPKYTATDTEFASGKWGLGFCDLTQTGAEMFANVGFNAWLKAPASPAPHALRLIEVPVRERIDEHYGKVIEPQLSQNIVDAKTVEKAPVWLKRSSDRYEILRAKGFTDEEIEALLGGIPKHEVDTHAVTLGAFDYKGEPTMLVVITGDNPYQAGAILKQEEYAKSKSLKVFKPPRDITEVRELHKQIKADRPDIVAGVHNLAYQTIGDENLEPLAVADFYDGFTQGIYDMKDLEKVPEWELERTIRMWTKRLEKSDVPAEERDKHMKRLKGVLKQ